MPPPATHHIFLSTYRKAHVDGCVTGGVVSRFALNLPRAFDEITVILRAVNIYFVGLKPRELLWNRRHTKCSPITAAEAQQTHRTLVVIYPLLYAASCVFDSWEHSLPRDLPRIL